MIKYEYINMITLYIIVDSAMTDFLRISLHWDAKENESLSSEEFQPFLGKKRRNRGQRSGQTNFDPIKGFQVW